MDITLTFLLGRVKNVVLPERREKKKNTGWCGIVTPHCGPTKHTPTENREPKRDRSDYSNFVTSSKKVGTFRTGSRFCSPQDFFSGQGDLRTQMGRGQEKIPRAAKIGSRYEMSNI